MEIVNKLPIYLKESTIYIDCFDMIERDILVNAEIFCFACIV